MSQQRAASQLLGNSFDINQNSGLNSIGMDSLTQEDSLFINTNHAAGRVSPFGAGPSTTKAPRYATNTASSNLRTIQPALMEQQDEQRDSMLPLSRKLAALQQVNSGPIGLPNFCDRGKKPSTRNKVLLTRSVDLTGSMGAGSVGQGFITARMHLNKNTTLELIDIASQQQKIGKKTLIGKK